MMGRSMGVATCRPGYTVARLFKTPAIYIHDDEKVTIMRQARFKGADLEVFPFWSKPYPI
jgi:hypothetical protein